MTNAHGVPFLTRKPSPRAGPFTPGDSERAAIEIVAPDQYCAALLLGYAAPLFPAEIVAGPGWIVRLQSPAGAAWVPDLLSLVERWLAAVPLPATKVTYGGRDYLIRAPSFDSEVGALPESASQPAA
jgi:hypothetical protein